MNRSAQLPGWDLAGGGGAVLLHASSESDLFAEFFGALSPDISPRTSTTCTGIVGVGEEEEAEVAESSGVEKGIKMGASTSGAKGDKGHRKSRTEEVEGRCHPQQKRKRNRTTEMHNLMERRRRDRIKEKLKALQELIPNSHKLDRASLLDQAITYMKSLQLQLQIMSGGGHCQSPCISPRAMQCLHMPHFNPFSHIGMGYGMGVPGMTCLSHPHLLPNPSPLLAANLVHMPGVSTIPTHGPPLATQPMPFAPWPEFHTVVTAPATPSQALQAGPFSSSYQVEAKPIEAARMQSPNETGPAATTC